MKIQIFFFFKKKFIHFVDMVRLKNRWLLFEVIFEDTFHQTISSSYTLPHSSARPPSKKVEALSTRDVYSAIKDSIQINFGDYGVGCIAASISGTLFFNLHEDF